MKLQTVAKAGFTSLSPDRETIASFDREGRLYAYFKAGTTYRRSLASTVHVRWRDDTGTRQRACLSRQEASRLFAEVYSMARDCLPHASPPVQRRLKTEILRWTPESLLAETERFAQVYKPITILPPDQYLSIVLQATEGCTWNRCTFCSFYGDRPFRAKSHHEFSHHVRAVQEFLGRTVLMRKGLFLADGNALALSQTRLEAIFAEARAAFPDHPIYSFVDLYTGARRQVTDWKRLVVQGLHRVYIGMETGLDELLQFLNKPGSREELLALVTDLKRAGVAIGLIVMVGVGGAEYREAHGQATIAAIQAMPLNRDDLVYLSPFVEHPDSVYSVRRAEASLTPMSDTEVETELKRLAAQLRSFGIRTARYDIREFLY